MQSPECSVSGTRGMSVAMNMSSVGATVKTFALSPLQGSIGLYALFPEFRYAALGALHISMLRIFAINID